MIKSEFITHSAQLLGDTEQGLSGSQIVKYCVTFASKFDVSIPYNRYPFIKNNINKRTALADNLFCFSPEQQFEIILFLCNLDKFQNNKEIQSLKLMLLSRYSELAINLTLQQLPLIEDIHWLAHYPKAQQAYQSALQLIDSHSFNREVIDNLRLSLELLLHQIFNNQLPLEKQADNVVSFVKEQNLAEDCINLYKRILNIFVTYQNKNAKHNLPTGNPDIEARFLLNLISALMTSFIYIHNLNQQ